MAMKGLLLATIWLAGQSVAAPTGMLNAFDVVQDQLAAVLAHLCLSKSCLYGDIKFDLPSFTCSCPDPPVRCNSDFLRRR